MKQSAIFEPPLRGTAATLDAPMSLTRDAATLQRFFARADAAASCVFATSRRTTFHWSRHRSWPPAVASRATTSSPSRAKPLSQRTAAQRLPCADASRAGAFWTHAGAASTRRSPTSAPTASRRFPPPRRPPSAAQRCSVSPSRAWSDATARAAAALARPAGHAPMACAPKTQVAPGQALSLAARAPTGTTRRSKSWGFGASSRAAAASTS
mmetsp:Transcript_28665/g.97656  ORF Transcript_28665/g.97656 Transcript_28665/m.97656 type:complete len:211 (-) Transcript_28665:165-797(-)